MTPPARITLLGAATARHIVSPASSSSINVIISTSVATAAPWRTRQSFNQSRLIHISTPTPATVHSISGTAPPPLEPPTLSASPPSASDGVPENYNSGIHARIEKKRRQAQLLKRAQELRRDAAAAARQKKAGGQQRQQQWATPLKRRFWKDVHVREVDGAYEIHLDARPLRHPTNKKVVRLPLSKPQLAYALALEWDQLESASQATKQHLIPLTSLVCRALDIRDDDAEHAGSSSRIGPAPIRASIASTLLRYLDTDSLLCWAPHPVPISHPSVTTTAEVVSDEEVADSLRALQERMSMPIVSYLTRHVWPGVKIEPVLEESGGLLPKPQAEGVRDALTGWILGLGEWDLAGLEKAVLAGKGLLGAARLVAEWSEGDRVVTSSAAGGETGGLKRAESKGGERFGVEEAARTASVEVDWQTRRWGEVEDTHDVEKEDLRRQLGSVVLLVSGDGRRR